MTVGVLAGGSYLLVSTLIGVALLYAHNQPAGPAYGGSPPGQILPLGVPDTNTPNNQNSFSPSTGAPPDSSDTNVNDLSSNPTTTSSELPGGYSTVTGPDNMTTEIPSGWAQVPSGTYVQANDPADSGRFVRYGATPAPAGDLLASLTSAAQTNPTIQTGYQQVQLITVAYHGDPAVDWEFEYVKAGVTRHIYSRYWEAGGIEYFVYVSSTSDRWSATSPIFDAMANAATP
jgi:hypothetical protein